MQTNEKQPHAPIRRTAGERWFDWSVYGGVGYLANVALSIGAIWAADRTRGGKAIIDKTAAFLADASGAPYQKLRPQVRFTTLLTGGFAVLLPIKMLEDRKGELIKRFDAQYYDAIPDAGEQLKDAHDKLDNQPRQSWTSILSSRLLAMVPFYSFTGLAMKKRQALSRATGSAIYGEKLITHAARRIDAALHANDPKALAEIAEKNRIHPDKTVNSFTINSFERPTTALADYTITEAVTSGIVAGFLYLFTRLTAPILGKAPEATLKPFSPVAPIAALHNQPNEAAASHEAPPSDLAAPKPHVAAESLSAQALVAQMPSRLL